LFVRNVHKGSQNHCATQGAFGIIKKSLARGLYKARFALFRLGAKDIEF